MKRIFFLLMSIIVIPYIVISIFNKEEIKEKEVEIDYKIISKRNVRILRNQTGEIDYVPLEEYILGVLAGEMPVSFELEALKAQAVAARSYVLKRMEFNQDKDYDVIDTVHNQVYLDIDYLKDKWKDDYVKNINKLRQAIKETEGEYVMYDGAVADTLFFSTSNGYTENSEDVFSSSIPYLKSVSSSWDEKVSPVFTDKKTFKITDVCNTLNIKCSEKLDINITKKTNTGRITELTINGTTFKASTIYTSLKIRSTDFTVEQSSGNITFYTKGYGHGVGMSQYGALGMAQEGYSYKDILMHYYTGTTIEKI